MSRSAQPQGELNDGDSLMTEADEKEKDGDDFDVKTTYSDEVSNTDLAPGARRWHSLESQRSMAMSVILRRNGRERWANWCEFFWSATASAVGLGNIWKFPFVAAKHGGGAFLIPYIVIIVFIGYPMINLELGLGQFTSQGPIKVWEMAPICRGIGYMMMITNFLVATFYNVILGWCLNYFFFSFYQHFPWDGDLSASRLNQSLEKTAKNYFEYKHLGKPRTSLHLQQFTQGTGLDGPPQWHLVLGLSVGWIITWLVLVGGVKAYGKISYFLGIFPFVNLLLLLGASCALEGAGQGIAYFFNPQWDKLFKFNTWYQAASQCFFSLNIGLGELIMMASYREFNHDINSDALLIILMDMIASLLAGMSLFALMGNAAHHMNVHISTVASDSSFGIGFITYPQVIRSFGEYPGPQFFAVSFFFMLIVLSVGSGLAIIRTLVDGIIECRPKWNNTAVTSVMCVVAFLGGLVYCCPNGVHILEIVDDYGCSFDLYAVVFFQALTFAWIYGLKNIANDFEFMLGRKVSKFKLFCWGFVTPVLMIVLFVGQIVEYRIPQEWPLIAVVSAWVLLGSVLVAIPIGAIAGICTRKTRFLGKKVRASFRPSSNWGPKDPVIYKAWRKWKSGRPSEFECSTKICYRLGLRKTMNSYADSSYWSDHSDPNEVSSGVFHIPESGSLIMPTSEMPTIIKNNEANEDVRLEEVSTENKTKLPSITVTSEKTNN